MSSSWECARHGAVAPLHVWATVGAEQLREAGRSSRVPLWTPSPVPTGWLLSGLATAGDGRTPGHAAALAFCGPSPLGGPADLVLVAEEPGTGLGARYAGEAVEPGDCAQGPPEARVRAAGHPTALWRCASAPDRVAFVGEALGVWLWIVLWPPAAELMLIEHIALRDARVDGPAGGLLEIGAPSTRLA